MAHGRWVLPVLVMIPLACAQDPATPPDSITPPTPTDDVRVATWNIRFFPGPDTDERRAAEILATVDADLIAVQEIVDSAALRRLVTSASAHLANRPGALPRVYDFVLAESGGHGNQFVGFVYDLNSIELTSVETLTSLQMTPDLRPSLYAYVRSLRKGLDFQVIANHTDSGVEVRDYAHRMEFLDALAAEVGRRRSVDADIVALGDFNTMGHLEEGEIAGVTAEEEIAAVDSRLTGMGMRRITSDPGCTEYYQGSGSLLDHIFVASAMREVPLEPLARVGGYCAVYSCGPLDPQAMPYDYRRVSDHCPVTIDLIDEDWD